MLLKPLYGQILMAISELDGHDKACGFEIAKFIKKDFGKEPSIGTLYNALEDLKKQGFIGIRDDILDIDVAHRPRTYFKLEGAGQKALGEFATAWRNALSRLHLHGELK